MSADAVLTGCMGRKRYCVSQVQIRVLAMVNIAPLRRRIVADTYFGVYAIANREMIATTLISNATRSRATRFIEFWLRIYICTERRPEMSPTTTNSERENQSMQ